MKKAKAQFADIQQDADHAADAVLLNASLAFPEGEAMPYDGPMDADRVRIFDHLEAAVREYRAARFRLARAEGES